MFDYLLVKRLRLCSVLRCALIYKIERQLQFHAGMNNVFLLLMLLLNKWTDCCLIVTRYMGLKPLSGKAGCWVALATVLLIVLSPSFYVRVSISIHHSHSSRFLIQLVRSRLIRLRIKCVGENSL